MTPWTRRSFLVAAGAGLAACTSTPPGAGLSRRARRSTASVDEALDELYQNVPGASELGAPRPGHPGHPADPQGRLLRLGRLRRGRADDRAGQGRLLFALHRSASA